MVLLKRLDLVIHYAKVGSVYSKDAKAQTKFMQDIELATSTYYSNNLSEEVIKGMTEKAAQGFYPGRAPFGYRNNRETRNIEPSAETSQIVKRAYEFYATGQYSLKTPPQAAPRRIRKDAHSFLFALHADEHPLRRPL